MSGWDSVYNAGTIAIAGAATTVVGTGTMWDPLTNQANLLLVDGRVTRVIAVVDDTHLTIPEWVGAAVIAGAEYELVQFPLSSLMALTEQLNMTAKMAEKGVIYSVPDGENPDDAWGDDDDYALSLNPFKLWKKTAGTYVLSTSAGDVTGAVSSNDDAVMIWDGVTGKKAKASASNMGLARLSIGAASDGLLSLNVVMNPATDVRQEFGDTTQSLASGTAKEVIDGFEAMYSHAAGTAVMTAGYFNAAPYLGLSDSSFVMTSTTNMATLANGDYAKVRAKIEASRIARWDWGTINAKPVQVAGLIGSTFTGVQLLKISNHDQSRCFYHEVASIAGFNFFAFNVPGDTSGTWLKGAGVTGLVVELITAGKEATPVSVLDSWGSTNKVQSTNSQNAHQSNNNAVLLTCLCLGPFGTVPLLADLYKLLPVKHQALDACLRHLYVWNGDGGVDGVFGVAAAASSTLGALVAHWPRPFCVAPTITLSSPGHFKLGGQAVTAVNANVTREPFDRTQLNLNVASGLTAGQAVLFYADNVSGLGRLYAKAPLA